EISGKDGAICKQVMHPEPGHAAERDFEAAATIYSERIRISASPRRQLLQEFSHITVLMGQLPSFCQRDQVLMPIQLPDDFVVADLIEIEKINFEPGPKRRTCSVYNVEMPINLGAIIKIFVS